MSADPELAGLPQRPDAPPPEPDAAPEPEPAKPSAEPLLFITVIVLALVFGAVGLRAWINEPGICDGLSFASASFGYCVNPPAGWAADADPTSVGTIDRFVLPNGSASMLVSAHKLGSGSDVQAFAEELRDAMPDGIKQTSTEQVTVAGQPALQWDRMTADESITTREVVFIRGDVAWRVQFSDATSSFPQHVDALTQLLDSWRFA